jgi:hypothetical protein
LTDRDPFAASRALRDAINGTSPSDAWFPDVLGVVDLVQHSIGERPPRTLVSGFST